MNAQRLTFWSSCARTVVDLMNLRGLLVAVVPEVFRLYKILGRRSVQQVRREVLHDVQFELMAVQLMNSPVFAREHDMIRNNAESMIDNA